MPRREAAGQPALVIEISMQVEPAVPVEDQGHGAARSGLSRDAGFQQAPPHCLGVRAVAEGLGDIGQGGADIAVQRRHADHEGRTPGDPGGIFGGACGP